MTVYELVKLLLDHPSDYVIYVESPDGEKDYFVDSLRGNNKQKTVHICTAE